jgi:hypothetical protein
MRPRASSRNRHDGGLRDAVLGGDLPLGHSSVCAQLANLFDLRIGQLGLRVARPARRCWASVVIPVSNSGARRAALLRSVAIVVCGGARRQVGRIAARRIVAAVHDRVVQRWRAVRQVIRQAMRRPVRLAIRDWVDPRQRAIAAWIAGTRPRPALSDRPALDARPEHRHQLPERTLGRHSHIVQRVSV